MCLSSRLITHQERTIIASTCFFMQTALCSSPQSVMQGESATNVSRTVFEQMTQCALPLFIYLFIYSVSSCTAELQNSGPVVLSVPGVLRINKSVWNETH